MKGWLENPASLSHLSWYDPHLLGPLGPKEGLWISLRADHSSEFLRGETVKHDRGGLPRTVSSGACVGRGLLLGQSVGSRGLLGKNRRQAEVTAGA